MAHRNNTRNYKREVKIQNYTPPTPRLSAEDLYSAPHETVSDSKASRSSGSKTGSAASLISHVGGHHMQNDARLGITWSHQVSATLRAAARAQSASENGSASTDDAADASEHSSIPAPAPAPAPAARILTRDPAGGLREYTPQECSKEAAREARKAAKEQQKSRRQAEAKERSKEKRSAVWGCWSRNQG
ncbi:hypothetical protein ACN47E_007358 [Coniothyrium glycines]